MKHLLSPLDFSVEELDNLMDIAKDIEANPEKYAHACEGKKLATLFYEPSTRTRLSHEAAMINLGGSVLGFSSADSSSASKGESVADTIRVISCFADICAMRHPKEGAAMVASQHATIPVINAGDTKRSSTAYSFPTPEVALHNFLSPGIHCCRQVPEVPDKESSESSFLCSVSPAATIIFSSSERKLLIMT